MACHVRSSEAARERLLAECGGIAESNGSERCALLGGRRPHQNHPFQMHRRISIPSFDLFSYDVSPDGQRFLVATNIDETNAVPISLVLKWNRRCRSRGYLIFHAHNSCHCELSFVERSHHSSEEPRFFCNDAENVPNEGLRA